jgi:uncharacterized protein YggL (DUF469 family)
VDLDNPQELKADVQKEYNQENMARSMNQTPDRGMDFTIERSMPMDGALP